MYRYTVYWREQAQSAQVQTRTTTALYQAVGQLPAALWYDFWVRAETRVGPGPATPITTVRVQDTGARLHSNPSYPILPLPVIFDRPKSPIF